MATCPKCRKPREVSKAACDRWFRQNPADGPFTSLAAFLADYCMCDGQLPEPPADPPLPPELVAPFTSDPADLLSAAEQLRELGYDGLAAAAERAAHPGAELVRFLYTGPAPVDPDAPFHTFIYPSPSGLSPGALAGLTGNVPGQPGAWLPTMPGTQFEFSTSRGWCAGHRWRWRRGLGWLHRLGHRLRVLRDKPPRELIHMHTGPCS